MKTRDASKSNGGPPSLEEIENLVSDVGESDEGDTEAPEGNDNDDRADDDQDAPPHVTRATAPPPEDEGSADSRRAAEVFGALARECGTAKQFWLRKHPNPDDRAAPYGICPRPIVGHIDGVAIADRVGGGLVSITADNPYESARPKWHGPVPIYAEPRAVAVEFDRHDEKGSVVATPPTAPTPEASSPSATASRDADLVLVYSEDLDQDVWITRADYARRERAKAEAKRKERTIRAAKSEIDDIASTLREEQRAELAELKALVAGMAAKMAAPAAPQSQFQAANPLEKILTQQFDVEKERLKLATAEANARAASMAADAQVRMREIELRLERAESAPAQQAPSSSRSSDPLSQIDALMGVMEKVERLRSGGGPADSVPSVMREFLGALTSGARTIYGDGEDHGPLRKYLDGVADLAVIPKPAGVTVQQAEPLQAPPQVTNNAPRQVEGPKTQTPEEVEKQRQATIANLANDLTQLLTTLAAVCSQQVAPEPAWHDVATRMSKGFADEVRKRTTPEDLAKSLTDMAKRPALVNYAAEFSTLAEMVMGDAKPLVARFLNEARKGA